MTPNLIATPNLEELLERHGDEKAIAEFNKLRELQSHLMTHLRAIKAQTDSTVSGIQSLLMCNEFDENDRASVVTHLSSARGATRAESRVLNKNRGALRS